MFRMVMESLQKQIDQSKQNQDKSGIDKLRMVFINRIAIEIGFNIALKVHLVMK
jgi:hypothetical protein